jgi:8-oxo-dGTP diphosphatase
MSEINYYDTLAKKRIAAGMLFLDEQDRILLVQPTYRPFWLLPGGVVEADESPLQAAIRETQEEVCLMVERARLLCIDYVEKSSEIGESLQFIFYGGMLSPEQIASIVLPKDELIQHRLTSLEEACTLVSAKLARRLVASLQAARQGTIAFLENGEVPPTYRF